MYVSILVVIVRSQNLYIDERKMWNLAFDGLFMKK